MIAIKNIYNSFFYKKYKYNLKNKLRKKISYLSLFNYIMS
jgi:hypothetical protein